MSARVAVALAALALAAAPALADGPDPLHARVQVSPSAARLGEPVRVVSRVFTTRGVRVRFHPPEASPDLTWGRMSTALLGPGGRSPQPDAAGWFQLQGLDTVQADVRVQVFQTGIVTLPGLQLDVLEAGRVTTHRMPAAQLAVIPLVAASDSTADLRPLRGPLGAPWWEQVPWTLVGGALLGLAALVLLVRALRRRRRPAPSAAAPPAPPARAPLAEALAALAALRADRLPERGRFADHAFRLSALLRRYLERVEGTPRPGDTSRELVLRLRAGHPEIGWVERVEGLLMRWDRVKFARVPSTVDEAHQAEAAVETLLRKLGERAPAAPGGEPGKAA